MTRQLLDIRDLRVEVEGQPILNGVDLTIAHGQTHVIFGPNGSGKSTLLRTIMGLPPNEIKQGEIRFEGEVINDLPIDRRVKMGLGLGFQHPPAIEGIQLRKLLELIAGGEDQIKDKATALEFADYLSRNVNQGFSGGERKKNEVLQLLLQQPSLALFDEPDSGVDLETLKLMADQIGRLLNKGDGHQTPAGSGLIITHHGGILNHLEADYGHVMVEGVLSPSSDPVKILRQLQQRGYQDCYQCLLDQGECSC